jgi:hypothetical protein
VARSDELRNDLSMRCIGNAEIAVDKEIPQPTFAIWRVRGFDMGKPGGQFAKHRTLLRRGVQALKVTGHRNGISPPMQGKHTLAKIGWSPHSWPLPERVIRLKTNVLIAAS